MSVIASQITSLTIVYSIVYSGADQRKHPFSASLALCAGNSPVTGEFLAQRASNAETSFIWWRHHDRSQPIYPAQPVANHSDPSKVIYFTECKARVFHYYRGNYHVFIERFSPFNILIPEQNGRHFEDDIFNWILFKAKDCILIQISLTKPTNAALFQAMAWCRIGDKPSSEPTSTKMSDGVWYH